LRSTHQQFLNFIGLIASDLDDDPSVRNRCPDLRRQAPENLKAILPTIESQHRIVLADLGRERGNRPGTHIRWVCYQDMETAADIFK
jgi:hypothetical protein